MIDTIKGNKDLSKQEKMVDRVLNQYGHDSISELASVQIAIEGISNIALNDIEKSRVGVSFLEKSTRFIDYTKDFSYYIPTFIYSDEDLLAKYKAAYTLAQKTFTECYKILQDIIYAENPITQFQFRDSVNNKQVDFTELTEEKDIEAARRIHSSSIREYILDNMGNMLPSGITTNVAMNINFRSLRDMCDRLYASKIEESVKTYHNLIDVIKPYGGDKLLKRVSYSGDSLITYRKKQNDLFDLYVSGSINSVISVYNSHIQNYHDGFISDSEAYHKDSDSDNTQSSDKSVITYTKPIVDLGIYNDGILNEAVLCASIMTEYDDIETKDIGYSNILNYFNDDENHSYAQKKYLIENYVKNRENKHQKVGTATEFIDFVFEIQSSYRTWRDLRRHRTLTRVTDRVITPKRGLYIPPEFHKNPEIIAKYIKLNSIFQKLYNSIMEKTNNNYYIAQYATLLGNVVKYTVKVNMRELITLAELRTEENGHFEYREICHQIFDHIKTNSPLIANMFKFINLEKNIKLGKLKQNSRTVLKELKT